MLPTEPWLQRWPGTHLPCSQLVGARDVCRFLSRCQLARPCQGGGDPAPPTHSGSAAPPASCLSDPAAGPPAPRSTLVHAEVSHAPQRGRRHPVSLCELGLNTSHSTFPLYSNKTRRISAFHRGLGQKVLETHNLTSNVLRTPQKTWTSTSKL